MQLSSEVQGELMHLIYCMYGGEGNWYPLGGLYITLSVGGDEGV